MQDVLHTEGVPIAEIIVVHGHVGSGKTTQGRRVAEEGFDTRPVRHVSAGNRLRAIRMGAVASRFSEYITAPSAPSPLPDEITNDVMFEAFEDAPDESIVLLDGYPRHSETIDLFREAVEITQHQLLGMIVMEVSKEISTARLLARGKREGEEIIGGDLHDFALSRYDHDLQTTDRAIEILSKITSTERIDASSNKEIVYSHFRSALGRLALKSHRLINS